MILPVRVSGAGIYIPQSMVTAADLDARLGLAPGTSLARNGVATRYFAGETETSGMMGASAIERALSAAGFEARTLDAVLYSSVLPEQPMPGTAILIHRRLGCREEGVTCLDINASCAGFLRGMEAAAAGIHAGLWRRAAVVAVEIASKGLRWDDPDTATLFGDGAAAVVMERSGAGSECAILASRSDTLSDAADLCEIRVGGSRFNIRTPPPHLDDYLFSMQGRRLLSLVRRRFPRFLDEMLAEGRRLGAPLKLVVPHQASAVGLEFLRGLLAPYGLPAIDILTEFGNQVSASLPFALHQAIVRGLLLRGDTALMVGTAAGLTLNGLLLRY